MFELILGICMIVVFWKLAILALHGVWGLTKILFTLIFLPFILIGLAVKGLIIIAVPALIIFGIVALLSKTKPKAEQMSQGKEIRLWTK